LLVNISAMVEHAALVFADVGCVLEDFVHQTF